MPPTWQGTLGGNSTNASITLPMTTAGSIKAVFIKRATLTIIKNLTGNLPAEGRRRALAGGSVSPAVGVHEHAYDKNEVVPLVATAAAGWRFKNWSGGVSGTNPSTTITMGGNKTVTASFIQRHTVTAVSQSHGIVTPESATRDHGQSVSFKWEKEANFSFYQFTHWAGLPDSFTTTEWGIGTSDQKTISFPVNDSHHLIAYDEPITVQLTAEVDADGCTGCTVAPTSQGYLRDTEATVTATPGAGWGFVRWEGDVPEGMEEDNPLVMTMDENKNVTAVFGQVTLTASVDAGGCTNCQSDPEDTYECEDCTVEPPLEEYALANPPVSGTVTAIPGAGWAFDHWEGSVPIELAQNNPLTLPMDSDKNVTAVFETARLKITIDGEGTTNPEEGEHFYTPGSNATITATPTGCWSFSHWGGSVPEGMEHDNPLILPMTHDRSIFAHFAPPDMAITSITFSGDVPLHWDDANWADDMFESDGVAIPGSTPHWAESGPTKPLCAIKDQSPGISAVLESPPGTTAESKLKCTWTVDSATLTYVADVTLTGGPQTVTLSTSDKVPNKILNVDSQAEWSVSCDGGTTWDELGSGSIKTFVIYGAPYSGPVDFNDDPWCQYASFVPTVKRIDLLCSGANGLYFKKEIAQAVAVKINAEWTKAPSVFRGADLTNWPVWRRLDPVNEWNGLGPARMLDCYSGKMLCVTGLLTLGIPRNSIKSRTWGPEHCAAYASTDTNSGVGYSSDCTDIEVPSGWCNWGVLGLCETYPDWNPHPEHPGPGRSPVGADRELLEWELNFDGHSRSENFFKILADDDGDDPNDGDTDDNEWYYFTVVPPLSEPKLGDGIAGTELDKAGRYQVLIDVNPDRKQYWFQRANEWIVEPANPLP